MAALGVEEARRGVACRLQLFPPNHGGNDMGKIHGNGGDISSSFDNGVRNVTEKMGTTFENLRDRFEGVGGKIGGLVRQHPVASLAAGVGIGVLVAKLLTRK
jgi:ElaB/YqjD/DUF883 family membrane-anchored ribosome-binding protein